MSSTSLPFTAQRKGRGVALAAVVLGHVALIGAMARLQLAHPEPRAASPLQVALIAEVEPQLELPPPPKPLIEPPRMDLIAPDFEIQWHEPPKSAITVETLSLAAPTPLPSGNAPVLVSEVEYLTPPRATYPPLARRKRQEGVVIVKAVVDVGGHASHVEVERSSGHELLDHAACEAVKRTRFRPHVENGVARAMLVTVPIEFRLNNRVART
jgi:periplasmic protein TonB